MKRLVLIFLISLLTLPSFSQNKAFDVKVFGKGQPVIMIPGYSCSGEVWNETVEHMKNNYELHVITLAGFAGVPPIEEEMILQSQRDAIIQYVKDKSLDKPILIGHSLGAFMSLWLHTVEPKLFGKTICVDGLPFISAIGNPATTVDSIKNNPQFNKEMVINNFLSLPKEGYVDGMTRAMLQQVRDTVHAKRIAQWSFDSDRRTLGSTIIEMSLTDLRDDISVIESSVLILASTFGTKEMSENVYNTQYAKLKNKTIKVADSKHFIMYDQPEWFFNEIDAFLSLN